MEKDISVVSTVPTTDGAPVTVIFAASAPITFPPTVTVGAPTTTSALTIPMLPAYAKPFLDISEIEVLVGQIFKRWQECIYSTLDMHGVA